MCRPVKRLIFLIALLTALIFKCIINALLTHVLLGVDCVLQVGYRRHSRMTERCQVLPLQFRCEAGLMLCN